MRRQPKWATTARKARLVELWARYGNRCLQGHPVCPDPSHYVQRTVTPGLAQVPDKMEPARNRDGTPQQDSHGHPILYQTYKLVDAPTVTLSLERLYDVKSEDAVRHWRSDDAAQKAAEWRAERERMHRDQRHFRQGEFDSIRRQLYLESQPPYRLVALTLDPLTSRPVAKVKVSSTIVTLFVTLAEPMGAMSKSARRKARRYGKPLPEATARKAEGAIAAAVQDWWASRSK